MTSTSCCWPSLQSFSSYGKIFSYLNDNLNQAYLTTDLVSRVLRSTHRKTCPDWSADGQRTVDQVLPASLEP